MPAVALLLATTLALVVLWEIFETIVLPRRIDRLFRLTRYYYLAAWNIWGRAAGWTGRPRLRAALLSVFGPFSLLLLFIGWVGALTVAFALMHWALGSRFNALDKQPVNFWTDLYVSGTTMTTLGLGDVTPRGATARILTVVEGGLGLGLVALVVSYLPALYQAFSRREVDISLLDARAGSPPSATELLRRAAGSGGLRWLEKLLSDWERWCAEIMESHISYPVLCYFRSQHTNQNWVTAITAMLDTCAFCIAYLDGQAGPQAQLTFAMARHTVVDITQVFHQKPQVCSERLTREVFAEICRELESTGLQLRKGPEAWQQLEQLRILYEPYVATLGQHLRMDLAPWTHPEGVADNWVATKWRGAGASDH